MDNPLKCHFAVENGVDAKLAKLLPGGYTKEDMAALRGIYDSANEVPLFTEEEEQVMNTMLRKPGFQIWGDYAQKFLDGMNKLAAFTAYNRESRLREMKDTTKHMAGAFSKLYKIPGWTAAVRRNRINMIVWDFVAEVNKRMDAAKKAGLTVSRLDIINGHKVGGEYRDGQFSIFDAIFDKYRKMYTMAANRLAPTRNYTRDQLLAILPPAQMQVYDRSIHRMEEFEKILKNWAALCTFARMTLKFTEGLKLGATLEYADPTTVDNFDVGDYSLEEFYDPNTAIRDAWQQLQETISTFGSIGSEVRRFLSTIIRKDENGDPVKDDLGYYEREDPLSTHQYLVELLRGVRSESEMIKTLQEEAGDVKNGNRRVANILEHLADAAKATFGSNGTITEASYPVIITQLFCDMRKNFVRSSALVKAKDAIGGVVAKILNNESNPLHAKFILQAQMQRATHQAKTIYAVHDGGQKSMDMRAFAAFVAEMRKYFPEMTPGTEEYLPDKNREKENIFTGKKKYSTDKGYYSKSTTDAERKAFLQRSLGALGIEINDRVMDSIFSDYNRTKRLIRALKDFTYQTIAAHGADKIGGNFETLVKYSGIRPSTLTGATIEEITRYDKAYDVIKSWENGTSYDSFLSKKYGRTANDPKSKGAGYEHINKILDVIAEADDRLKVERRVPWFDRKGKVTNRYADRIPNYMGDLVLDIRKFVQEGNMEGLKKFLDDKWGKSEFFKKDGKWLNRWLEDLYNSISKTKKGETIIDKEAFAKVFDYLEFLGSNIDGRVDLFENFTERMHAEAMLKQFIQSRSQTGGKSKLARYPSFVLGDSGRQMFFIAPHYGLDKKGKFQTAEILTGLLDVFTQELIRMKQVREVNNALLEAWAQVNGFTVSKNQDASGRWHLTIFDKAGKEINKADYHKLGFRPIANFSETANRFTMLEFLNKDYSNGRYFNMLVQENYSKEQLAAMSEEEAMDLAIENKDHAVAVINEYMKDAEETFKKKLEAIGVLTKETVHHEDGSTTERLGLVKPDFFGNDIYKYYGNKVEDFIKDFFWNCKYATIQQLQLFTVDPAFYDSRYPVKDLQKRYKEIYAPGKTLSLEAMWGGKRVMEREKERVAYFDDVALSSKDVNPYFFNVLTRVFGKDSYILKLYTKNTLTDGQGYRSLKSYRAIKIMSGDWTQTMEDAYNSIMKIRQRLKDTDAQLTDDDIRTLSELAVIFQPIKPYMFTLEEVVTSEEDADGNKIQKTVLVPVQHKYAEIVLIPELMADGQLKEIAEWMEANDVDLVASDKCVKVGAFGQAQLTGVGKGGVAEALSKAYIHELNWSDYRIQMGVPEHLTEDHLFGTQIRKLILDGIMNTRAEGDWDYDKYLENVFGKKGVTVYLPGLGNVSLSGKDGGRNYVNFYNALINANLLGDYDRFAEQCSSNEKLSNMLIQNIIAHNNQTEDNAFGLSIYEEGDQKGEFVIPPGEPGMEHDASALLWSLFKKAVNKQRIFGGSAVQASPFGLSASDLGLAGKKMEGSGELFEVVDPDGSNVLYDEIEMPWNRVVVMPDGTQVPLEFTDWCNPDGTLKLSDKIVYGEEAKEYLSWPVLGRDQYGKANVFNIPAMDLKNVEVEITTSPNEHEGNKTLKIYLKGQRNKGWFELVKDREEGQFSVHFKTAREGSDTNHAGVEVSTKEERKLLFEELVKAIPEGAIVSTWGNISEDGIKGLNNVGRGMDKYSERTIHRKSDGSEVKIPVFKKEGDYFKNQGYYVPLIETRYKGILDIILSRIPTEKNYSVINGKVFRFTPPILGGVLKVPLSRTTTAGFDFDIDKLNFFLRAFVYEQLSSDQIDSIWKEIYVARPDWFDALRKAYQADLDSKVQMFKISREKAEKLKENPPSENRYYKFWKAAGLPGTAREAFHEYLMLHAAKYLNFEKYDPTISPLDSHRDEDGHWVKGNTRAARDNMLFDLMRQRLMDPATLLSRYTPGGFRGNSAAALRARILEFAPLEDITDKKSGRIDWGLVDALADKILDPNDPAKDPEPAYDISDPTTILVYNQQNQIADKLIGIAANQNTNHVYASTMHTMKLVTPIAFGNHAGAGLFDFLHGPEGIDVNTNVAEYLAASVDAVKDPVLNFLNLNLTTANAGCMLARLGYTPMEIGLLFNQPIVKDLCNIVANEGVSNETAINKIAKDYGLQKGGLAKVKLDPNALTSDALANNILQNRRDKEAGRRGDVSFAQRQLQVLRLMNDIFAASKDLNDFVQATRFTAANSIGSTWGDFFSHEMKLAEFVNKYNKKSELKQGEDKPLFIFKLYANSDGYEVMNTSEDLLNLSNTAYMEKIAKNPFAFEQCMHDLIRKAARKIFSKHFPYFTQLYSNMRNLMQNITKYGSLDADTINSLHREFMVYILSKQKGTDFDGEMWCKYAPEFTNRQYYTQVFPMLIAKLKEEGAFKHLKAAGLNFFDNVFVIGDLERNGEKDPLTINIKGMGALQSEKTSNITEEWAQLFNTDVKIPSATQGKIYTSKELAEGLFFYNFYKMGFNFHPKVFMNLAPTLLKLDLKLDKGENSISYVDFIRKLIKGDYHMSYNELTNFAKQYILNHLDNYSFVFTPKFDLADRVAKLAANSNGSINTRITISRSDFRGSERNWFGEFTVPNQQAEDNDYIAFRPAIAVEVRNNTYYYIAESPEGGFNLSSDATASMTYTLAARQGARGRGIQYFSQDAYEAFQMDGTGNLEKFLENKNAQRTEEVEDPHERYTSEEAPSAQDSASNTFDTDPTFVNLRQGRDVFDDKAWNTMFAYYRATMEALRDFTNLPGAEATTLAEFKNLWADKYTDISVQLLLKGIKDKLDRGELRTVDEEGKPIKPC